MNGGALGRCLAGCVVFLTRAPGPAWVDALLRRGGAAAVVAPAGHEPCGLRELESVWPLLLAGQPLLAALRRRGGLHLFALDAEGRSREHA